MIASVWAYIVLLLKGTGVGFAVAAPVGPIGMLCIRTTLERGRLAGFCAGLGAAVADTLFATVAVFGLSMVRGFLLAQSFWFSLFGGIFIVAFGIHLARKRPSGMVSERAVPQGLLSDFLMTLLLTLANPATILSFTGIFAGLHATGDLEPALIPVLLGGVFLGSAGWWLALSGGIGFVRHHVTFGAMVWMNRIAGGLLIGFGLYTLGYLAFKSLW